MRPAVAVLLLFASCVPASPATRRVTSTPVAGRTPVPVRTASATATPPPTPAPPLDVLYRVDVRVPDGDGFRELVAETMADPRGWVRAGFIVREDRDAPHIVVLAEGPEVDALCLPYDTYGEYSCQNGPVVAINAERWREGVGHIRDLGLYRRILINHEMGHLLGGRHVPCPGRGRPAPVMFQQSGSLRGCRPNAWPLDHEIARAAVHDQPIAPGYGE